MNKIIVFTVCFIIILTLVGCAQPDIGENDMSNFFSHNCEFASIEDLLEALSTFIPVSDEGIKFSDVIAEIGKPQSFTQFTPPHLAENEMSFQWETKNGERYFLTVKLSEDCPETVATLKNIMEYGYVFQKN